MEGVSMSRLLAALAAAALLALGAVTPAHAASPSARITIEAVDLAGAGVPGILVTIEGTTTTTDARGRAKLKLPITPGQTLTATANGTTFTFPDVDDGDRLEAQITIPIAQGYDIAWAQADLDGDTLYDTVWHQPRANANDRWIIQLTTGPVRQVSWGGDVVSIFSAEFTDDPANELVAIEQLADGEHKAWIYSEVADDEDRISLGVLPSLAWTQAPLDADAHNDILFYGGGETGPWQFTIAYSATQRATSFDLGEAGAYLYEETTDIAGDGLDDIVVAIDSPDIWTTWWVWDSADQAVHIVEMGLYNGQPATEGFGDCDADGLLEFISVADIEGSTDRIWTSYEYASHELYDVTLGPEDDRGPGREHCPPEWLD